MSGFDRHQSFMDVISWILYWGTEHGGFDDSLKWIAEFLKYLCGYTTQDEEDWFDGLCNDFYVDLTGRRNDSHYLGCSKSLWGALRHCKRRSLFTESVSMNIVDCFDQMDWHSPKRYNMSGAQFAALLLCNPKQKKNRRYLYAVGMVSIQRSCNIPLRRSSGSSARQLQSSCRTKCGTSPTDIMMKQ